MIRISLTLKYSMLKKIAFSVFILCFISLAARAQVGGTLLKTYRIAIFSPLYLDSVFSGDYYRHGKTIPKFAQPGLHFVQGAQVALDSMMLPNTNTQVSIYDSKAYIENIPTLISSHKLDSIDLIIGGVKDAEFSQLAAFAKEKNIPFISSVFPNDGAVTQNPFLVIMNSTLKAHCEAIHTYLVQNHGTDKIFLATSGGSQEKKIAGYFKLINESEGKPLLNIKEVNYNDNFGTLISGLDSTRKNIIIGGSLGESFSADLLRAAYGFRKNYEIRLIGMPNWDGFSEFRKTVYKDFPVLYTTPYSNTKTESFYRKLQNAYQRKYKGAPSDLSCKGFESVYMFATLLSRYPYDFMSHLNDSYKVFNEYNFKPVFTNKKSIVPDYFENKHLYFMKIMNGKISGAW